MKYAIADDIARLIAWQRGQGMRPLGVATLEEARANRRAVCALLPPAPQGHRVVTAAFPTAAGNVEALIATMPQSTRERVVIYVHGGGWSLGQARDYEALALALAAQCKATVVVPDFALAPEHPYPQGMDQIDALLAFVQAAPLPGHANAPAQIVLVGDSSGGNMCAAAALHAVRQGRPVDAQVLIYPAIDPGNPLDGAPDDMLGLTPAALRWFVGMYTPDEAQRSHPRVAPAHDPRLDLSPPTIILTAEHDILNPQIDAYEQSLRARHVPVASHRIAGQIHTFIQLPGVLSGADEALALIGTDLTRLLA